MATIEALDLAHVPASDRFRNDLDEDPTECDGVIFDENDEEPPEADDEEYGVLADEDEDSTYVPLESLAPQALTLDPLGQPASQTQTIQPGENVILDNPSDPSSDHSAIVECEAVLEPVSNNEEPSLTTTTPLETTGEVNLDSTSAAAPLSEHPSLGADVSEQTADTVQTASPASPMGMVRDARSAPPCNASTDPIVNPVTNFIVDKENVTAALSAKVLQEQCALRKLPKSGNKQALIQRILSHIAANPDYEVGESFAFDDSGARVQGPMSVTQPTTPIPAWVELSVEEAARLRLKRPEWTGHPKGGPSLAMKQLTVDSHPCDFFDMFITAEFRQRIKRNTNAYAAVKGGGSAELYPCWKPCTDDEVDRLIGLYTRHGLAPVPDIELLFANPVDSFAYGDERVQALFPRGFNRFKELKAFLHVSNPLVTPPANKPFHKVDPILDHLRDNSIKNWDLGPDVSQDEIDIGFQGRCSLKDKIKYKGEGDGFLADAICDRGYVYVYKFRNDHCPVVEKEASPLHNRCLWLVEQCKYDWLSITFDNLFTSKKYLEWLYDRKKFGTGVCRTSGRGLPACVQQDLVTRKADLEAAIGTVKVARSTDFRLVAMSLYDSKPVHLMSSKLTNVKYIEKSRMIWDGASKSLVDTPYQRLNWIDFYNLTMNSVDLADQYRNQYRMDGPWMRQKKWWWAIFLWALEAAWGNAYLCYRQMCVQAKKEKYLSHRKFLEAETLSATQTPSDFDYLQVAEPTLKDDVRDREIRLTTFNILAPIYKRLTGDADRESDHEQLYMARNGKIIDHLIASGSSILCLQEFWHSSDELRALYTERLTAAGYALFVTPRTNNRGDGLLTAHLADQFALLDQRSIFFNDCADRVAQLSHFTLPGIEDGSGEFLLVNLHLLFPHNTNSTLIRLRQVWKVIEYLQVHKLSFLSVPQMAFHGVPRALQLSFLSVPQMAVSRLGMVV
ncbi:hypothetical protein CYMTET_36286 [Cymbomonas tetramitiformis]|uniref:SAP domain-containing protein n=1 Tax=Cymbomonas tetramitiformis TaxID=36881 RepID=A0AAE0F7I8_9CHLO|nr:hypothetical protein CYMTET_36286 [Cymbomonas tetramitiformis]